MSPEVRECAECGYENEPGCSFCIQCGHSLAPGADGGSDEPQPHPSPEVPAQGTEELLRRIVEESGFEHEEVRAGWRVNVPLAEDRGQKVYVTFAGHDDEGNDLISFLGLCGEAEPRRAMDLLRLNARPEHCHFAVKTIEGTDYFVVCGRQLAETADPQELRLLLARVAARADAVEKQLNQGRDVF